MESENCAKKAKRETAFDRYMESQPPRKRELTAESLEAIHKQMINVMLGSNQSD